VTPPQYRTLSEIVAEVREKYPDAMDEVIRLPTQWTTM
jgi:hypothetical protein